MLVSAREHFGQPVFVVLWHFGNTDAIQIDIVFPVKRTAPNAKFQQRGARCSTGAFPLFLPGREKRLFPHPQQCRKMFCSSAHGWLKRKGLSGHAVTQKSRGRF
jgi:hypothetical protein